MVALTQLVSDVTVRDNASAPLDKIAASFDRVADAQGRQADVVVKSSRAAEVNERQFVSLRREVDNVYDAQLRFAKVQEVAQRAIELNNKSQEEATQVIALHRARLDAITGATNNTTAAFKLNAQGVQELRAAGVNAFQAYASGIDLVRVASTEGAQVLGAFVQGGVGLGNILTAIGTGPLVLAAGAVAALGAAFFAATRNLESFDDKLKVHERSLEALKQQNQGLENAPAQAVSAALASRRGAIALAERDLAEAQEQAYALRRSLEAEGGAVPEEDAQRLFERGEAIKKLREEYDKLAIAAGLYGDRSGATASKSDEDKANDRAKALLHVADALEVERKATAASIAQREIARVQAQATLEAERQFGGAASGEKEKFIADQLAAAKLKQATAIGDVVRLTALETDQTSKVSAAYTDSAAAGLRAAAVRQATLEHERTGIDTASRAQAILREEIEKTAEQGARQVLASRAQAEGIEAVAAASLNGAEAEAKMQVQVKADLATLPLRVAAAAAEGDQKQRLLGISAALEAQIKREAAAQSLLQGQQQINALKLQVDGAERLAAAAGKGGAAVQEAARQNDVARFKQQALAKATDETREAVEKQIDAYDQGTKSALDFARQAQASQAQTGSENALALAQREFDLIGALPEKRAEELAVLQKIRELKQAGVDTESQIGQEIVANTKKTVELQHATQEIDRIASGLSDAIAQGLIEGGRKGLESIKRTIIAEFEHALSTMVIRPLIEPVVGGLISPFLGAGAASAAGAAGAGGGLFGGGLLGGAGLLGSGASLFSGGSSIFSGINSFGASTGLFGTGSGGLPGVIGTPGLLGSQTLSGFLGGVGLGFGGGALLNSIAGGNSTNGLIGSGIGAIGGTILGGPIGGLIGGSAGGLLGGFFGPGKSVGPGQAAFTNFGPTGSGLGNSAIYADADNGGSADAARQALAGPAQQLLAAMKALGITTSGFALRFDSQGGNNGYRLGLGGGREVDLGANPTASGALLSLIQNNRLSASGSFGTALRSGGIQSEADLNDAAAISAAVDSIDKLKDALGNVKTPADQAKDAVAAIGKQFDDFEAKAAKFGLDVTGLRATEATLFNSNIQSAIDQIEDPLKAALDVEKATADARLEVARKLGADMTLVGRLNADEVKKINDQFAKNVTDQFAKNVTDTAKAVDDTLQNSLKSTLHNLIYGSSSALSPSAQYASARASYSAAEAQALAGNAPANFGDIVNQFVTSSRDLYASSPRAAADFARATGVLQQVTGTSDGTTAAVQAMHADIVRGNAANEGRDELLANLQSQVLELQSQIARLMSASRAA